MFTWLRTNRGFSGLQLKLLAVAAMVLDHTAACGLVPEGWYQPLRTVGRLAFPIFAFLLAEGAAKTRNSLKYLLRLLLFAVLSELPYDLLFHQTAVYPGNQNIFFTLLAGLGGICAFRGLERKLPKAGQFAGVLVMLLLAFLAQLLGFDYGLEGVLLIFAMYSWRTVFWDSLICPLGLCCVFGYLWQGTTQMWALAAFVPLFFYNGERGRKVNKYLFYAFYPVHLLVLLTVCILTAGSVTL